MTNDNPRSIIRIQIFGAIIIAIIGVCGAIAGGPLGQKFGIGGINEMMIVSQPI